MRYPISNLCIISHFSILLVWWKFNLLKARKCRILARPVNSATQQQYRDGMSGEKRTRLIYMLEISGHFLANENGWMASVYRFLVCGLGLYNVMSAEVIYQTLHHLSPCWKGIKGIGKTCGDHQSAWDLIPGQQSRMRTRFLDAAATWCSFISISVGSFPQKMIHSDSSRL